VKQDSAPKLADIADQSGVSLSTVSYVLSGKRPISEPVRRRVLKAIEDLEYRPNGRARALASGATHALALLLPSPQHKDRIEHHSFVAGAAQATSEVDYSLVLSTSAARAARVGQLVDQRRVDGLILMEIDLRDRRVQQLRTQDYAFSVIGHPADTKDVNFVDIDIATAVRRAVEHLVEYGHRRIVIFNEAPRGRGHVYGPACRSRVAFAESVAELGVDGFEVDVPRDRNRTYEAAIEALSERRPTAVIALGTSSPAIVDAARDLGLRIPNDLSLIGFLVPELAELLRLTNVDFPVFDMGHFGAKMLINRLVDPDRPPTQLLLQPPLTVRNSTGPVPRKRRGGRSK
jgi:DNA-binding LacI/PurR family transcriptional regulator